MSEVAIVGPTRWRIGVWGRDELARLTPGQRWTVSVCAAATALFLAAGLPGARVAEDQGISGSLEPATSQPVAASAPPPAAFAPPPAIDFGMPAPAPAPAPAPMPAPAPDPTFSPSPSPSPSPSGGTEPAPAPSSPLPSLPALPIGPLP